MRADKILIVEDDEGIGSELLGVLEVHGYAVVWAQDGHRARQLAAGGDADLVLLDLGLPDADGVQLCRELRRALPDALIVALTARTAERDAIMTLDAGADDYLTKPFRLGELLARLRAHLRNRPAGSVGELRVGTLFMDLLARTVQIRDESLHLRPKQFDLLAVLAGRAGAVVTREHLMSEVWDEYWSGPTKTLDVHVSALRRKLGEVNSAGQIVTSRGRGYRYEAGG